MALCTTIIHLDYYNIVTCTSRGGGGGEGVGGGRGDVMVIHSAVENNNATRLVKLSYVSSNKPKTLSVSLNTACKPANNCYLCLEFTQMMD